LQKQTPQKMTKFKPGMVFGKGKTNSNSANGNEKNAVFEKLFIIYSLSPQKDYLKYWIAEPKAGKIFVEFALYDVAISVFERIIEVNKLENLTTEI